MVLVTPLLCVKVFTGLSKSPKWTMIKTKDSRVVRSHRSGKHPWCKDFPIVNGPEVIFECSQPKTFSSLLSLLMILFCLQMRYSESTFYEKGILISCIFSLHFIVGTDSRRQITIWKHHPTGCVTALKHKHAVECLTYSKFFLPGLEIRPQLRRVLQG